VRSLEMGVEERDDRMPPLEMIERYMDTLETQLDRLDREEPEARGESNDQIVAISTLAKWMRERDMLAFYHDAMVFFLCPRWGNRELDTVMMVPMADIVGLPDEE
jgi:hypothetical protein